MDEEYLIGQQALQPDYVPVENVSYQCYLEQGECCDANIALLHKDDAPPVNTTSALLNNMDSYCLRAGGANLNADNSSIQS